MASSVLRRVLVVAYYFPPMGLSGVQRTAKFVKYLPRHGWEPTVLTAEPGAYFAFDDALLEELVSAGIRIVRTRSLDPTRLFGGRKTVALPDETRRRWLSGLSQWFFIPDNKVGWIPSAYRAGRRLLHEIPFDAVFSTAPPYSGHLLGRRLAKAAGIPLITDYRDDWLDNPRHVYPTPLHRRLQRRMESRVMRSASRVVTINAPITAALHARHPKFRKPTIISQGFDPADYPTPMAGADDGVFRLVYTGVFYDAQTPEPFLQGLARFLAEHPDSRAQVEALFVGLFPRRGHDLIRELGLADIVRTTGYVSHRASLEALATSTVAWLTVGAQAGAEQISTGKLYAYIGASKPILGLVPEGAARQTLLEYGACELVPPDDVNGISEALGRLFVQWRSGQLPRPDSSFVQRFDRRHLAGELADLMESALDRTPS